MKYHLGIGINAYPQGAGLAGCVNDARDWSGIHRSQGYTSTLLLDREATGLAIRDAIARAVAKLIPGDKLSVTYSGHGSYRPGGREKDRRDEMICPVDVFDMGGVFDDELHHLFSARAMFARILFVSDSCHSGTVHRAVGPAYTSARNFATSRFSDSPKARFIQPDLIPQPAAPRFGFMSRTASIARPALLMSGCQDDEYSYDAWFQGRANGAFTRVAIDALESFPGMPSYRDWMALIRQRLPSTQYPQTPGLRGSFGHKHSAAL